MLGAVGLSLFGTVGHFLTDGRVDASVQWFWIAVFGLALLLLAGAAVNFDPKRWLK